MIEPKFRRDPAETVWIDGAACIGQDPELFFPVGTSRPALARTRRAKAICGACPVRGECLRWSLDSCQDAGIWGGLDEEERRVIRRERRRQAAEAAAGEAELAEATG
jgi:WhiB family redox-sensing transcriptional regulator